MNRRSFCALGGAGLVVLSGCLFNTAPDSGSLVIKNEHDSPHTVEITVRKMESDNLPSSTPTATSGPTLWTRNYTYKLEATERKMIPDFITEPGLFAIDARLDTGKHSAVWLSLYSANHGTAVGGGVVFVDIYEDGRIVASTPNFD